MSALKEFTVTLYQPEFKSDWDTFIINSKNGTFLFQRDFMEYHNNRFDDFSLLLFKGHILIGVVPAHRVEDTLYSHQGLTYGGLILSADVTFKSVLNSFRTLLKFLSDQKIRYLYIKEVPTIYHQGPSDEIRYLSAILQAQLERRDVLSVVENTNRLRFSKSRREGIKRGKLNDLQIVNDDDFETFWNLILQPNLNLKHNTHPVHSLEDILFLKSKFPDSIKQFNVYDDGKIVAGATIFETVHVAHCQYISGNADKNTLGSLDALHNVLINEVYVDKPYFDFGTSNLNNGQQINYGLQFWKEGFGARTITQDFYTIETRNYKKLDAVLV